MGMDTLDGRLKRVNDVFTDLLNNTLLHEHVCYTDVELGDKDAVSQYLARENLVEEYLGDTPGYTEVHGIKAL